MRIFFVLSVIILAPLFALGQDPGQAEDEYVARVRDARDKYRKAVAALIRKAEVVELAVLRFDDVREPKEFGADGSRFPIGPHGKTAGPLKTVMLDEKQRRNLLPVLANQIEKPKIEGDSGKFYPMHGIRVFLTPEQRQQGICIYSSTFSWPMRTFCMQYPDHAEFLAAGRELYGAFNDVLPVPKDENERFKKWFLDQPLVP